MPVIPAVRVAAPPVIDGVLDDAAWKEAPSVSEFWCIDLGKEPAESTTMWLAYDARHLYVAFDCRDSQPARIVAEGTKRGSSFERDDHVVLNVDPIHRHREDESFRFLVNARGTQDEEIPGGAAQKIEWRGDWQAAARVGERGYSVEMAIPVAMLRSPAGQTTFGVWARRHHARSLEEGTFPRMVGQFDRTRTADWTGLDLPVIRPPLRWMPYSLLEVGEAGARPQFGLDLKQSFPSGLTGLVSLRPDFRSIEGEVLGLDFSYNERLAEERRPFFVEGESFLPSSMLFASQRIEEIDLGVKTFGNLGATQLGFLGLYNDRHQAAAVRVDRSLSERLQISSQFAGRFDRDTDRSAWLMEAAYSRPSASGTPFARARHGSLVTGRASGTSLVEAGFQAPNGRLGGTLTYRTVGKNFEPADGYVPERDLVSFGGELEWDREIATGAIDGLEFDLDFARARHTDGSFFYDGIDLQAAVQFRNGTEIAITPLLLNRREEGRLYRDRVLEVQYGWNRFKPYRQGAFQIELGREAGGPLLGLELDQGFRFGERLGMSLGAEFRRGFDDGERETEHLALLSVTYDITPERGVGGRLVWTEDGVGGYLAYRQNVRRGVDAFLLLGDPNALEFSPRLSLKMVQVF